MAALQIFHYVVIITEILKKFDISPLKLLKIEL